MIILTFFLPLFSVSCQNQEVTFSGFEISFGKNIGSYRHNGNIFAVLIAVPAAALLIFSFFVRITSKPKIITFFKTISLIIPIFNIFAVFVIKSLMKAAVLKKAAEFNADSLGSLGSFNSFITVWIDSGTGIKYGFVLYIIFNAVVFIFASVNYFVKRE